MVALPFFRQIPKFGQQVAEANSATIECKLAEWKIRVSGKGDANPLENS